MSTLPSLDPSQYRNLLRTFLAEDLGAGDVTTDSIVGADQMARGDLVVKAPLVLAGVEVFLEVFYLLDPDIKPEIRDEDGAELQPGAVPVELLGHARALLTGERVALNLLQRMSAVATLTHTYVRAIRGTAARIVDTRKTTPGLRALEKYAVRVGGGSNHRKDLGEAILVKDNHIRLAGGVDKAMAAVQGVRDKVFWTEVEATNLDELRAALASRPDTILLDNMNPRQVSESVSAIRQSDPAHEIRIEASGGINLSNVRQFAEAGVDWISIGALTHSAPSVDLSFEIEPA